MGNPRKLTVIPTTRQIGSRWEKIAESFLQRQGLTTRVRNFHCRCGEIDLIMNHEKFLVFVEVRFRGNDQHGSGAETITHRKQTRLIRAAGYFLGRNPGLSRIPCRFDVISIGTDHGAARVNWIRNAFESPPG